MWRRRRGFSVRTVSCVLNQAPNGDARTREAVTTVIEQLGFRRNSRARGLAAGRSFLLGVVQDDPNTHVIAVFQRGIASLCAEEGYELVVHSSLSDERLVDDVVAFVQRSHVDGIILLPPLSEQAGLAEALAALKVPAVGIAAVRVPGFPGMLVSDERGAARRVAQHLAHLGHRTIGFITGGEGMHSSIERELGFRGRADRERPRAERGVYPGGGATIVSPLAMRPPRRSSSFPNRRPRSSRATTTWRRGRSRQRSNAACLCRTGCRSSVSTTAT